MGQEAWQTIKLIWDWTSVLFPFVFACILIRSGKWHLAKNIVFFLVLRRQSEPKIAQVSRLSLWFYTRNVDGKDRKTERSVLSSLIHRFRSLIILNIKGRRIFSVGNTFSFSCFFIRDYRVENNNGIVRFRVGDSIRKKSTLNRKTKVHCRKLWLYSCFSYYFCQYYLENNPRAKK